MATSRKGKSHTSADFVHTFSRTIVDGSADFFYGKIHSMTLSKRGLQIPQKEVIMTTRGREYNRREFYICEFSLEQ